MYGKGTIKLTWVDNKQPTALHSAMVESIEAGIAQSANKNNWLLMELIEVDGDKYKWKLLPYGSYRQYLVGAKITENKIYPVIGGVLIFFGAVYIINAVFR